MQWPPEHLHLALVEPVEMARRTAVERVEKMAAGPVVASAALPAVVIDRYDIILANHVLYYVAELRNQLARLIGALSPQGVFTTAIAGHGNALIEFWKVGFGLLGREIPYNVAEDVESALADLAASFDKQQVGYELEFADTEENRLRIIRFLLADYLPQMPRQPLLDLFDRYSNSGRIAIQTASDHFTVEASVT
jgi:SAM-dependent methyltransferase